MALKYATTTCAVRWKGGVLRLHEGDAWSADDEFVKARPEFFADDPTKVHRSSGVEQMTARPGEKRAARRG